MKRSDSLQRSRSASKIDVTGALGQKISKDFDFELIVNKRRKLYPLLMRRYKSIPHQKPAFMLESLLDLRDLQSSFRDHRDSILENFTSSKEHDRLLFQPEKSIEKGALLLDFDPFIQCKFEVSVTGSKVFIDTHDQILGLMDCIDLFFSLESNKNFGEGNYEKLIGNWVDNDEDYGVWGDSMDSEFCNEFLFEDG